MDRIERWIRVLADRQWRESHPLRDWRMRKTRYVRPGHYEELPGGAGRFQDDRLDGVHGITYFLTRSVAVPREWEPATAGLLVQGGGEGLLRINGASYHGIDRNHSFIPLYLSGADQGRELSLEIELYDPIPEPVDPLNRQATIHPPVERFRILLVRVDRAAQQLLYTVQSIYEAMALLPGTSAVRRTLNEALHRAMREEEHLRTQQGGDMEGLTAIERTLAEETGSLAARSTAGGKMHMIGQSHIDIAWLWPVRETVRKASRTFSTMLALMEEYPDFVYTQSQPLLYAFAKEHDPQLYAAIKQRVAEGRWELVGGMWVEPDLNIPSGESLVRQMLHGQLFYQEEFDRKSHIEWLPDTFGYCASLPQLLKLAGVEYFMTTKLNWNDTNKFPYELFHWVGIDGTSILSYLNHGLNEHTRPADVEEHWREYRQQDKLDELMLLYGHGDGGGGVTRQMLEFVRRSPLLPGLPEARMGRAAAFFERVEEVSDTLPRWHGDLYLELHRGTYTTHARNKRSNRLAEVLYRDAEVWSELSRSLGRGAAGPPEALKEGWRLMLLNQFHDIIPGTAITEAYETSREQYEQIFAAGTQERDRALRDIALRVAVDSGQGTPYVLFNSLGWERTDTVILRGGPELRNTAAYGAKGERLESDYVPGGGVGGESELRVTVPAIPAFGYAAIWLRERPQEEETQQRAEAPDALGSSWETASYLLEFNERGEITRWLDKANERELLRPGAVANELQLFHDRPLLWDAWDIDPRYEEQRAERVELLAARTVLAGDTADILRFEWRLNESRIEQELILHHRDRRVDFRTRVDWRERHKLLKAAFPFELVSQKATYEIPFGALERATHRNTSWEQAQYEVCGHRWADVSEGDYGISLLNDCKYGYDIRGGTMRLSLLRASTWPDEFADIGEHEFTYSLYPHDGDWRAAQVVRKACELNHPVVALAASDSPAHTVHPRSLPTEGSLMRYSSQSVILDTIKPAERGKGTVVRLYESCGSRDKAIIALPPTAKRALLVNLLEEALEELDVSPEGTLELSFKPYEIRTIRMEG